MRVLMLIGACGLLMAGSAQAAQEVPIQSLLNKTGTRVLAVEFYADWCEPCKKAVPKWRQLLAEYRDRGLRLLVIKTQTELGKPTCAVLDWQPDAEYCDSDGSLLANFTGKMEIPSAFLWSWQGKLLVQDETDIQKIEAEIRQYFKDEYRINAVDVIGGGSSTGLLQRSLRTALSETGRFDLLAEGNQSKKLAAIRKKSHSPQYSDEARCELGELLSPNASLVAKVQKNALFVELLDAERGCVAAAARADLNPKKPSRASRQVVKNLLTTLKRAYQRPLPYSGRNRVTSAKVSRRQFKVDMGNSIKNTITDKEGFLTVHTEPDGADIFVNGQPKGKAPWQDSVAEGQYVIVAKKGRRYYPGRQEIRVGTGEQNLRFKLVPAFGNLTIRSEPVGAVVWIDDQPKGKTPFELKEVLAGRYQYELRLPHYHVERGTVTVQDNQRDAVVEVKLKKNTGDLMVSSVPKGAKVYFDGRYVGQTPHEKKHIRAGVYTLRVEQEHYLGFSEEVKVTEGSNIKKKVQLKPNFGTLKITSEPSGAEILLNGEETSEFTPFTFEYLKPGLHRLELMAEGYGKLVKQVRVANQKTKPLHLALPPKLGRVSVLTQTADGRPCKAKVYVNGKESGTTPWKKDLIAVKHQLRFECLEGKATETITVVHNEKQSMKVTVIGGASGKLSVNATDLGSKEGLPADVTVDGHILGKSPVMQNIEIGPHQVNVYVPGYKPETYDIEVGKSQRIDLSAGLRQIQAIHHHSLRKWIATGLSGASLLAGTGLWLLSQSEYNKAQTSYLNYENAGSSPQAAALYTQVQELQKSSDTYKTMAITGFGLAVVSGVWASLEWSLPWEEAFRIMVTPMGEENVAVLLSGEF